MERAQALYALCEAAWLSASRAKLWEKCGSGRILVLEPFSVELSTLLSEAVADHAQVTLIDKSDAFVFGFAKLDVMFGRATPEAPRGER